MREYARSSPTPKDAKSVEAMIQYLEALNKLFEKSLLGRKVNVYKTEGTTLSRMSEGFNFFAEWAQKSTKGVSTEDGKQQAIASKESTKDRNFLAWQVNKCVY